MSRLSIVLMLSLFISGTIDAQWVPTKGPGGGNVQCLLSSGGSTYAGTDDAGIFFSSNNGVEWTAINGGLTYLDIREICEVGTTLLTGTAFGGVFRSSNNGHTWTHTQCPGSDVLALATDGSAVFASTYAGLFRSTDLGTSWDSISPAPYHQFVFGLMADGDMLYASTDSSLHCSSDDGNTWTPLPHSGLQMVSVCALFSKSGKLFAGTLESGVFRSTDDGQNWTAINEGIPPGYSDSTYQIVSSFAAIDPYFFAGTGAGVLSSTDDGETWSLTDSSVHMDHVTDLAVSGGNLFAAVHGAGAVYRSTDYGTSWRSANAGLANLNITLLAARDSVLYAAVPDIGVFASSDEGASWKAMNSTSQRFNASALSFMGDTIYVGTQYGFQDPDSPPDMGVLRTTNNGTSWETMNSGLESDFIYSMIGKDTSIFVGPSSGGVYRLTQHGTTWTSVNSGLPGDRVIVFTCFATSGENLYTAGNWDDDIGVRRSTNNGASWTPLGLAHHGFTAFHAHGSNVFAGCDSGVYRSTNYGAGWKLVNDGLPIPFGGGSPEVHSFAWSGTALFAGTPWGVYCSTNDGTSWSDVSEGLPQVYECPLAILGSTVYVGTSRSVWRRPLSEIVTSVRPQSHNLPVEHHLQQNYPNPCNPTTVISYQLPSSGHVILKVYNLLGHEMATLVDGFQQAGYKSVSFDGAGLPSGVYLYRLSAGTYTAVKKMVLLK